MSSISNLILLLVNNFMQISVDIWALRDKMLRDDPNLLIDFWSSTRCLWNKLLANANQLLCRKYQRRFFFEEVTFDHVPGKEKDQVSPMFISEHQRKTNVCRFCKITQFFVFFIISKVCWTVCVFHFLNLESLKRIYASLFTFRDFRHRCMMILKTLKHAKTAERNSTTSECIFHKLAVKNVIISVVKTIYCQRNFDIPGQTKL